MPENRLHRPFVALLLALPAFATSESSQGTTSASSSLRFSVVVPPVFRVIETRQTRDGYEYRVWTNTKSVVINGREYRFERIGENVLKVPAAPGESVIVHGL